MNLDGKIKEAFARHESDVQPGPGAWSGVEKAIGRRHKMRIALTAAGVAMAIAAAIVVVPRLGSSPDASFDSSPAGWQELRQSGYRIAYPPDWTLDYQSDGFAIIAPKAALQPKGAPNFHITLGLSPEPYTQLPSGVTTSDRGSIAGRRYVRYSEVAHTNGIATTYRIEWPRVGACNAAPACTMGMLIDSLNGTLRDRYLATAVRIAATAAPVSTPQSKPARPRLIGKVPARVFALAAGSNSLWGLETRMAPDSKPATLLRIDPAVRKIMARIPVGYVPQAVAADDTAIWVTNASGCGTIASCGDASNPPTFKFPQQNSVMRIDPRTNKVVASIRVTEPQDVAIGFGSVWVTTGGSSNHGTTVLRIDPKSNRVIATIRLGRTGEFAHLGIGKGSVFVTVPIAAPNRSGDILRIDPATNRYSASGRVAAGSTVPDIAAGFDSVWTTTEAQTTPSALYRFDETNEGDTSTISLPDAAPVGLNAVTTGEGYVWAVSARGYLWKVDPATRQHSDPTTIGDTPPDPADAVVTGFGFVWVASGDGQIWQLAP